MVYRKNQFINILELKSLENTKNGRKSVRKIFVLFVIILFLSNSYAQEIKPEELKIEDNKQMILDLFTVSQKIVSKIPTIIDYDFLHFFNSFEKNLKKANVIIPKRIVSEDVIKAIGECKVGEICEGVYIPENNNCAQLVVLLAKKFYNVNYDLDHAWLLNQKENNVVVWNKYKDNKINYTQIPQASILGIKTKDNKDFLDLLNLSEYDYTHVVLYVGEIDNQPSVISLEKDKVQIFEINNYLEDKELIEIILPRIE